MYCIYSMQHSKIYVNHELSRNCLFLTTLQFKSVQRSTPIALRKLQFPPYVQLQKIIRRLAKIS